MWPLDLRLDLGEEGLAAVPRRRHAVVVGGSMAGMLAARVLADHFDAVTLLERDRFPEAPAGRKGLPQGRHAHALLERGRQIAERLLPGLTEELARAGAELLDFTRDFAWLTASGWQVRFTSDLRMLTCTRDLIDWGVRRRVAALPNVRVRQDLDITGLARGWRDEDRIAGVRLRSRTPDGEVDRAGEEFAADLVVVADGRHSRLPEWLGELGYEPPEDTVVNSFQGYASRSYRPPAGFAADWKSLYIQQAPPGDPRGGILQPVEGGRWVVSLIGGDGDYPPTDDAGFLAFARSLRSPALYEAIAAAEPLTPIVGQRATENRLRHYDRLVRFPDGVVAVGDAVCAFNPVYGQGMTAAAIGAKVLDRWLRERAHRGPGGGRVFQRRLARATAAAWQLATGADYRFRAAEGPPQGRVAQLTGRYFDAVIRAATRQPWVRRRLADVLQLLRPPSALLGPGVLVRVAWDWLAGRADAGERVSTPLREGTGDGLQCPRRKAADLGVATTEGRRGRSAPGKDQSGRDAAVEARGQIVDSAQYGAWTGDAFPPWWII
jgi:2-polyprenyl-6-methoxyphenol hydroxylase-like FAD-dependent oxidoreductase